MARVIGIFRHVSITTYPGSQPDIQGRDEVWIDNQRQVTYWQGQDQQPLFRQAATTSAILQPSQSKSTDQMVRWGQKWLKRIEAAGKAAWRELTS